MQAWFAQHPRVQVHLTLSAAFWLNIIECRFRDLTTERLRRSVPELTTAVTGYNAVHNEHPKPFIWTAKAGAILQKMIRVTRRLSSKQNEALHEAGVTRARTDRLA